MPWEPGQPGVIELPSGRLVRGRGLREPLPPGREPEFGLYLQGKNPPGAPWQSRWVRWRDWWLPSDPIDAREALVEAWERAPLERVEVACTGGIGRTGTALACLAILDGVPVSQAVDYVRRGYHWRAVENPWQGRFVRRFRP